MKRKLLTGRLIAGLILILILTVLCSISGCGLNSISAKDIIKKNSLDFTDMRDQIESVSIKVGDAENAIFLQRSNAIEYLFDYLEEVHYVKSKNKGASKDSKFKLTFIYQGKEVCDVYIGENEWIVDGKVMDIKSNNLENNRRLIKEIQEIDVIGKEELHEKLARGGVRNLQVYHEERWHNIWGFESVKFERMINEMKFVEINSKSHKKNEKDAQTVFDFCINFAHNPSVKVKYVDGLWRFHGRSYRIEFRTDDPFTKEEVGNMIKEMKDTWDENIAENYIKGDLNEILKRKDEFESISISRSFSERSHNFVRNMTFESYYYKKIEDKEEINKLIQIFNENDLEVIEKNSQQKIGGDSLFVSLNVKMNNGEEFEFYINGNYNIVSDTREYKGSEEIGEFYEAIMDESRMAKNNPMEISEYAMKHMKYRKIDSIYIPTEDGPGVYSELKKIDKYISELDELFRNIDLDEIDVHKVKDEIKEKEMKFDSRMVIKFKNDMRFDTLVYGDVLIINQRAYRVSDNRLLTLMNTLYNEQFQKICEERMDKGPFSLHFRYNFEKGVTKCKLGELKFGYYAPPINIINLIKFKYDVKSEPNKEDMVRALIDFRGFEQYEIYFGEDSWIIDGIPVKIVEESLENNKELMEWVRID